MLATEDVEAYVESIANGDFNQNMLHTRGSVDFEEKLLLATEDVEAYVESIANGNLTQICHTHVGL